MLTSKEDVARLMFRARTKQQIAEAERQMRAWIQQHPRDKEYLQLAGESLHMMKTAR